MSKVSMRRKERFERLRIASDEGHPALTIELGKLYLAEFPEDPWALIYYGMALQDVARYPEAGAAYDRALTQLPSEDHERIYRRLGLLAQDQSNIPEAEQWYRQAIDARPEDATAYIYLGAMLAKNGRLDEAEALHRRATACADGCLDEAYLNLGYVLRAKERYLDALECFREALRRDSLYEAAQEALADMEQVLFRFPEA
jgi:tetratricopeptide (TPR) repeat protein